MKVIVVWTIVSMAVVPVPFRERLSSSVIASSIFPAISAHGLMLPRMLLCRLLSKLVLSKT